MRRLRTLHPFANHLPMAHRWGVSGGPPEELMSHLHNECHSAISVKYEARVQKGLGLKTGTGVSKNIWEAEDKSQGAKLHSSPDK